MPWCWVLAPRVCSALVWQGSAAWKVLLIDHSARVAEKIRISGGGRCNFTNVQADRPECFIGAQPGVRTPCAARLPGNRVHRPGALRHGIPYHEKHRGQLVLR